MLESLQESAVEHYLSPLTFIYFSSPVCPLWEMLDSSMIFFSNSNITDWIGEAVFHRSAKMIRLQTACFGFTDFVFSEGGC